MLALTVFRLREKIGKCALLYLLHQHIKYIVHIMHTLINYTRLGIIIILYPNGYVKGVYHEIKRKNEGTPNGKKS